MRLSTLFVSIVFVLAEMSAALPIVRENMLVARFGGSNILEARVYGQGPKLYSRANWLNRIKNKFKNSRTATSEDSQTITPMTSRTVSPELSRTVTPGTPRLSRTITPGEATPVIHNTHSPSHIPSSSGAQMIDYPPPPPPLRLPNRSKFYDPSGLAISKASVVAEPSRSSKSLVGSMSVHYHSTPDSGSPISLHRHDSLSPAGSSTALRVPTAQSDSNLISTSHWVHSHESGPIDPRLERTPVYQPPRSHNESPPRPYNESPAPIAQPPRSHNGPPAPIAPPPRSHNEFPASLSHSSRERT